ncbi:MAG: membrane-bound lytic murein transglycosylase F [Porticoccaceae bacterium]|nr:MAG: membrane-bound lytic murein transglycosylase F [Porticoccaceae bacterium]
MRSRSHALRVFLGRAAKLGLVLTLAALVGPSRQATNLETILERGVLRFATRPGPITYFEDAKGPNGFEYLLAKAFADSLGLKLAVTTSDTLVGLFNLLGGPNADFIGATLTVTESRKRRMRFSRPYGEVVQVLVYRRGSARPRRVEDLLGHSLAVVADSSHEERLRELAQRLPDLRWQALPDVEMVELLEMVEGGEVDFAVVDSSTFEAHRTRFPSTARAFDLTAPQALAWAFPRHADGTLLEAANRFLTRAQRDGTLARLEALFFRDVEQFSVAGSLLFKRRLQTRLPRYRAIFETVAGELDMDWHLLAAIAYQESHWNPEAVSPTGVRGMMMLTRETAAELGVADRTDPLESIRGGGRYFLALRRRLPEDIAEPDRTLFALAAYNVGLGHLEDARLLADRAGRDPHLWREVEPFLPLLERRRFNATVRHGYARGREAVQFVRNVVRYRRILQWNTIEEVRRERRRQRHQPPELPAWDLDRLRPL